MTPNRRALRTFLTTYGRDAETIARGLKETEPLMDHAECAQYELGDPDERVVDAIAAALRLILNGGGPVRNVAFISAKMPDRGCLALSSQTELEEIICRRFGAMFKSEFALTYREDEWRAVYWGTLGNGLRNALASEFDGTKWKEAAPDKSVDPRNQVHEAANTAIFYYLGFAMLGDAPRMDALEPLIRILPRHVPFAWRQSSGQGLTLSA